MIVPFRLSTSIEQSTLWICMDTNAIDTGTSPQPNTWYPVGPTCPYLVPASSNSFQRLCQLGLFGMELTGRSALASVLCLPMIPSPIMTITPCDGTPSTTIKKAAVPGAMGNVNLLAACLRDMSRVHT